MLEPPKYFDVRQTRLENLSSQESNKRYLGLNVTPVTLETQVTHVQYPR
jgi:hypothetical protein